MSWILKLYETYENCGDEIGKMGSDPNLVPLLPIGHSTQNAQIEVVLTGTGEFRRARALDKNESVTIIPVTEDSASRGNIIAPHPLCDKLQYVAGDYTKYVDKKNGEAFHTSYIKQLEEWADSDYPNPKVSAVLTYLKKRTLISDLINLNILVAEDGMRLKDGVKLGVGEQSDAFIRFKVEMPGELESAVWLDKEIYRSYIGYYGTLQRKSELCYVQAKEIPCSEKHPAKMRNTADKAKLISANDDTGYTYRGRFANKSQVVNIGYDTSQKAHNALKWLIAKQGYRNGEQAIVAWGTNNQVVPEFLEDTQDGFFGDEIQESITTEKEFATRLNKSIAGYGQELDTQAEIVVMGLNAATTGRLSINYYRELTGHDFLDRIKYWHSTCIWRHTYKKISDGMDEKNKARFKYITFVGAPSPKDITLAAYGERASDHLQRSTVERLLPCIIDGAKLPYDLVNQSVNRASNPASMENWEWQKTLTVACALVKKYRVDKFKEVWEMALDKEQRDRSYIFGRLLAIAQQIEEWALSTTGEKRDTNAERLMHQFKLHPYKTWGVLTDKLKPYMARLGPKGRLLTELMTEVNALIPFDQFTSSKKLEDSYILGYYCQRQVFIDEKKQRFEDMAKLKLENMKEEEIENE